MSGSQLIEGAKRFTGFRMDPKDILIAGLDVGGKDDPLYDERIKLPLDEAMVESIIAIGVREPVVVVVREGEPIVVDGRRRVLHAREANRRLEKLGEPTRDVAVVAEKGTEQALKIAPLVGEHLNNHRVNDGVIMRAKKAERMIARGYDKADVALALGVTQNTISNYLSFGDLCKEAKDAVDAGKISPSAAAKLATLSKDDQKAKLEELLASTPAGKKVTNARAAKAAGVRQAVGKKVLTKIVSCHFQHDAAQQKVSDDFIDGIRFALGELDADAIPGLCEYLAKDK